LLLTVTFVAAIIVIVADRYNVNDYAGRC
jgi:hypothetical protein